MLKYTIYNAVSGKAVETAETAKKARERAKELTTSTEERHYYTVEEIIIRKAGSTSQGRTQRLFTFRLDLELDAWINGQRNKGRYINELIRRDRAAYIDRHDQPDSVDAMKDAEP